MGQILPVVRQFFDEYGWAYNEVEAGSVLRARFGGKNGEWDCYARVREEYGQFVFYSLCPLLIPEALRTPAAVLINQANFGLQIGNFEMDVETGAVQCRTSIDVEGAEQQLTPLIVKHLVYSNVLTMDQYLPAFEALEAGGVSAEEALALVE